MNSVLSTEYFPPISTFWCINNASDITLEIFENYQKKSTRNRALILAVNGVQTLSVPLQKGKSKKRITEVEISYDDTWQADHLHSIRSAYGNAPYFQFYYEEIEAILEKKEKKLFHLNSTILKWCIDHLEIETHIKNSIEYQDHYPEVVDLRNQKMGSRSIDGFEAMEYTQVFEDRHPFQKDLSILDLLMCKGPESILYI